MTIRLQQLYDAEEMIPADCRNINLLTILSKLAMALVMALVMGIIIIIA